MSQPKVLRVAVNAPLARLFDYLPPRQPADLAAASMQPGARILVPFGRQQQTAMIVDTAAESTIPVTKLKHAVACIDPAPLLSDADLWLLRFASSYYQHPIGEVIAAALPANLRAGRSLSPVTKQLDTTEAGASVDLDKLLKRAPKQAALLAALRANESLSFEQLDERIDGWRRCYKALLNKEWLTVSEIAAREQLPGKHLVHAGPPLNMDQSAALAAIRERSGFQVHLLDGVTGSGKTEVYIHLIEEHLRAGRQTLIIVPEIGLTPQLVTRLEERLGQTPAVLHSGLSDTARLTAWRQARNGQAGVVLGTRSAVFVPLRNAGLFIVDEEHDNSLKQQEGFRYSARDLAIARAKQLQAPIILGTATPSFETVKRCDDGAYQRLSMPVRAGGAAPPLLRLVDLSREPANDGISSVAISAMDKTLRAGAQVLVFLNRRGFAPTLICGGCGHIAECSRCDARMTVHLSGNELRCHHCGAARAIDSVCDRCSGTYRPLGHGTERLEDTIRLHFPLHSIARIDSDTTRLRGAMNRALADATAGETRILIGTQMLSKGHHFPNLTLVVVVNADQGLFSTDFRGAEKLAQGLLQVAGRAGRERQQGEVLIQTAYPTHPFWEELIKGGYEKVSANGLEERSRTAWPPYSRLALLRASSHQKNLAQSFLESVKGKLAAIDISEVRVLGPVSAPMERRAGRYRSQLLFQSVNRQALQKLLQDLRNSLEQDAGARKVRWSIDVDPIELF